MSLTHCPLCLGLALLSVGRALAHLLLLGWLLAARRRPGSWQGRERARRWGELLGA